MTNIQIIQSSNIQNLRHRFNKNTQSSKIESVCHKEAAFLPNISKAESDKQKTSGNFNNFAYITGCAAAGGQLIAGLLLMGSAIKSKSANPLNMFNMLKKNKGAAKETVNKTSKALEKTAANILAASYLVSVPSCIGASIKSKQPSIFITSMLWGLASPFMAKSLPPRVVGFLDFSYVPSFAGFANEIHNKNAEKNHGAKRELDFNFIFKPKNYVNLLTQNEEGKKVRTNFKKFGKFLLDDQINAVKGTGKAIKETAAFLTGKRKNKPEVFSFKPTEDSMKTATTVTLLGSVPKIVMGKNLGKFEKVADAMLGAGILFDSIGMMTLGASQNDSRKYTMLAGGPLRMIGDFFHSNKFMYGLRTFGGSSFEYYFAAMNKAKEPSPLEKAKTQS